MSETFLALSLTLAPFTAHRPPRQGTAWSDHATGFNIAHGDALCSNRGLCNHRTGKCECKEGFEGKACGDMKCPANDGDTCRYVSCHRVAVLS